MKSQTKTVISMLFFTISGCSSETAFIPEKLPVAQVGKPYFSRVILPPGNAIYCYSFFAAISPIDSGITAVIKDFSTEKDGSSFCRVVDIQGAPRTILPIKITLTGGGPDHSSVVNQSYVIKVE